MVAISFSMFKDKLLSGEKDQTIRPYTEHRRRQFVKAQFNAVIGIPDLQIYWKQRTKECHKLFDAFLKELWVVVIDTEKGVVSKRDSPYVYRILTDDEVEEIVKRDGFDSVEEFFDFFRRKYGNGEKEFLLVRFRRHEPFKR